MSDVENGLASDFVKFLHSQLQETRDQLREKEEVGRSLFRGLSYVY